MSPNYDPDATTFRRPRMRRRDLELIRVWADDERRPVSVGYPPAPRLVRAGFLERIVDDFYALTEHGAAELERLRTGGPR